MPAGERDLKPERTTLPRFAIVVPCLNQGSYLGQALESLVS